MTYQEFSDKFLPTLAKFYRDKQIDLHGLVDFDLWKKIIPDDASSFDGFRWECITFNAFNLSDSENSLLLVYSIPEKNQENCAKFVAMRLDNKREHLLLYSLRCPRFYNDPWEIYLHNFKKDSDSLLAQIQGTNSLREFVAHIQRSEFRENLTIVQHVYNIIYNRK